MKPKVVLLAAAMSALAACSGGPQQGAASGGQGVSAPGTYETVVLNGSAKSRDFLYKINVKTGAAWVHCCSTSNSDFVPVADASPPPAGDYHLRSWSVLESDGSVSWNVYRVDSASGRAWQVNISDQGAPSWQELSSAASAFK